MNRPPEYDRLIKDRALEEVQPTPGAIAGYLKNAADYLTTAKATDPSLSLQVFTMAYEGYFQLVQAVLEHFQVRTKEAGRNLAILRVSADLKLRTGRVFDCHQSTRQKKRDFLPIAIPSGFQARSSGRHRRIGKVHPCSLPTHQYPVAHEMIHAIPPLRWSLGATNTAPPGQNLKFSG